MKKGPQKDFWILTLLILTAFTAYSSVELSNQTNTPPEIKFYTESQNEENQYIRLKDEKFGAIRIDISDDSSGTKLEATHLPQNLQLIFTKGVGLKKDELYNSEIMAPDSLAGEKFFVQVRRKDKNWIGEDSLVLKATDAHGATSTNTFYFYSWENLDAISRPQFNTSYFNISKTDSSITIKWDSLTYTDSLVFVTFKRTKEYSGTFCNHTTQRHLLSSIWVKPEQDSVVINGTVNDTTYDELRYIVNIDLVNQYGTSRSNEISNLFFKKPYFIKKTLGSPLNTIVDPDLHKIVVKAKMPDSDCFYTLFHQIDGVLKDSSNLLVLDSKMFDLIPGAQHLFYAHDPDHRFSTDTVEIKVNRPASPLFTKTLNISLQCKKKLQKAQLVKDTLNITNWKLVSNDFEIIEHATYLELFPLNPSWSGSASAKLVVTEKIGYTDTLLLSISKNPTNFPVTFTQKEQAISITNDWKTLNLKSYAFDNETTTDNLDIIILDTSSFRIDQHTSTPEHFRFRPIPEQAGTDTMQVMVEDEGCASDTMKYIITYSANSTGNYSKPQFAPRDTIKKYELQSGVQWRMDLYQSDFFLSSDKNFPAFYIPNYVSDDRPLDELEFSLKPNSYLPKYKEEFEKGLDVQIRNDSLFIKPKPDVIYPFYKIDDQFPESGHQFLLYLSAEDIDGKKDSVELFINIAEPYPKMTKTFYEMCTDTFAIDATKMIEPYNDRFFDVISSSRITATLFTRGLDSVYSHSALTKNLEFFIRKYQPIGQTIQPETRGWFILRDDVSNSESVFTFDIQLLLQPRCYLEPEFAAMPVHVLEENKTTNINLWDKISSEHSGDLMFWNIKAGQHLNYIFNYQTGELAVEKAVPGWEGKDTLQVFVEDVYGKKDTAVIIYQTDAIEAPVIYPAPQNITVKQGETIPVINLSNRVSDNNTLSEDIIWSVNSSTSEVNGSIQNQELTLTINDASWTGNSTIELIAEDEDGLTDTVTFTLTVDVETAINNFEESGCNFQSYPNPVTQTLTVETCNAGINSGKIKLLNSQGQVQFVQTFSQVGAIQVDVSRLNAGLYILQLESLSGESKVVGKVMVNRP